MIINAFSSGADSYMTPTSEDSNSPNWLNQIQGPGESVRRNPQL